MNFAFLFLLLPCSIVAQNLSGLQSEFRYWFQCGSSGSTKEVEVSFRNESGTLTWVSIRKAKPMLLCVSGNENVLPVRNALIPWWPRGVLVRHNEIRPFCGSHVRNWAALPSDGSVVLDANEMGIALADDVFERYMGHNNKNLYSGKRSAWEPLVLPEAEGISLPLDTIRRNANSNRTVLGRTFLRTHDVLLLASGQILVSPNGLVLHISVGMLLAVLAFAVLLAVSKALRPSQWLVPLLTGIAFVAVSIAVQPLYLFMTLLLLLGWIFHQFGGASYVMRMATEFVCLFAVWLIFRMRVHFDEPTIAVSAVLTLNATTELAMQRIPRNWFAWGVALAIVAGCFVFFVLCNIWPWIFLPTALGTIALVFAIVTLSLGIVY